MLPIQVSALAVLGPSVGACSDRKYSTVTVVSCGGCSRSGWYHVNYHEGHDTIHQTTYHITSPQTPHKPKTHRGDACGLQELVEGATQELVLDGKVVAGLLPRRVPAQVVDDLREALAVQLHGHGQRRVRQMRRQLQGRVPRREAHADLVLLRGREGRGLVMR